MLALALPCASRAAAGPAVYSNMVFVLGRGQPVYMLSQGSGYMPGLLFEVVGPGARPLLISPAVVAPLHVYSEFLDARRVDESASFLLELPFRAPGGATPAIPLLTTTLFSPDGAAQPVAATSTTPQPGTWETDIEKTPDKKLKLDIKGFRYIKYRDYSAGGNSESFLSQQGLVTYGDKIEQGTNLVFTATSGKLQVSGSVSELPLQERDMKFDVGGEALPYGIKFGDFTAEFNGGSLATLNKRITGAEVDYANDKYEFGFVASQSRSETKTISFNGNNTHGPYDLNTFEIVPNSLSVKINGQTQPPDSYDVDYYQGEITFCSKGTPPECRNIKTSDSVQVVFEQKLLLSLKGGDIRGFRGVYKLGGGRGSIGVAHLTQEANRAAERTRKNNTEAFTGAQLLAQGATDVEQRTIRLAPTSSKFPGLVFMVRYSDSVLRNGEALTRDIDYAIDYTGYAGGEIVLAATPGASDSFEVSYSYYVDTFINLSRDEDIIDTGQGTNVFTLSRSAVYAGAEVVLYCTGDNCDVSEVLQPGADKDYTIDEANNAVVIISAKKPSAPDNTFLRVTYYYVPVGAPESSEFDHTVQNIYGDYKFGEALALSFEYATSRNDVAKTPIQIMNEPVLVASATFTCATLAAPIADCVYNLQHEKIEEDSETLRFHTRNLNLTRGVNYFIDPNTGRVTFTGNLTIPAGTIVYASYRYNPDVDLNLVSGKALRLKGTSSVRGVSLSFNSETTDPFFASIGGNNTLETGRLDYTLSAPIGDKFNVDLQRSRFDTAQDIFETFVTANKNDNTTITYNHDKGLRKVSYTFGKTTTRDNRPIPSMDMERDGSALSFDLDIPKFRSMTFSYESSSESFADLTGVTDNTESNANKWALSYKPRPQLSLDVNLLSESVESGGVSAPYSTRNNTRKIQLTYQPIPLITLTADIDSQRQSDTRPEAAAAGVDTTMVRLTTMPFGKVRSLSYSITKQDRPSQFTGGSGSDVHNLTFTVGFNNGVSITPTSTISTSSSMGSSSKTTVNDFRVEYLPAEKKYEAAFKKEWSHSKGEATNGTSTNIDSDRLGWDFKYKLRPETHLLYKYQRYTSTSSASDFPTGDRRNALQLVHNVGDRFNLRFTYTILDRISLNNSRENQLELNSEYQLNKYLSWNLKYKMIKYDIPEQADRSYNGKILETELRLEF